VPSATTIGELRDAGYSDRTVKDELRANLLERLGRGDHPFPDIVGFDDSVVPGLERGILAGHDLILLGERGQAKTRLIRHLVDLLDEETPAIAGCEINDHPYRPICAHCRAAIAERGEQTPIVWIPREDRYSEKLATPDISVGDLIGDVCDANDDNDGGTGNVLDANDNCPTTANTNQLDTDGDGQPGVQPGPNDAFGGDACDPEDDGDGIDDNIDPQPLTSSDDFSDGTSSGTINARAGLFVRVRDEAIPDGVRVKPSGAGGPAIVSVCSNVATLSLSSGNETVATCGSATVQVVTGPVTMNIGNQPTCLDHSNLNQCFLRGTLPSGTKTRVTKTGNATEVCNTGISGNITFTGITITPGQCLTDSDTDGFFDGTETFIGTDPNDACFPGSDPWPPDQNSSGAVNIFDVGPVKAAFGSVSGEPAYSTRTDLNADTVVNISDLGILKRFFGQAC